MSTEQQLLDLNRECYCWPIDASQVSRHIIDNSSDPAMADLLASRQNYFANTGVFVTRSEIERIQGQINAIETVAKLQPFQLANRERDPASQRFPPAATAGAFMGYDFHLTADGPKLIEVNTNAGGAYIVDALERALGINGSELTTSDTLVGADTRESIYKMFVAEWRKSGRDGLPRSIAIVDEQPASQFHYPDMLLAAESLRSFGLQTVVVDPSELQSKSGVLLAGGQPVDIVYNRLTDFALTDPRNAIIRNAIIDGSAVVTPTPEHHSHYADKRNLATLSNPATLRSWGVSEDIIDTLADLPLSVEVSGDNIDALWSKRRSLFFKPNDGFGSRAAYRGAKLTSKVWRHIAAENYVAQEFIAPPVRAISRNVGEAPGQLERAELKFDVRVYTYDGAPMLYAARVYQGQTTNLRTAGGGLAPVLTIKETGLTCRV
ncbi:MAG: hypothetical protein NXH85_12075 [Pseudomonadaceae bacterium]|nr:hypothetical protein [Pseudomonadaceae bacterium]